MRVVINSLTSVVVIVTAAAIVSGKASAQSDPVIEPRPNETIAETFQRAFFKHNPNFYRNRSTAQQLELIFGFDGSFPEKDSYRDGRLVNQLYNAVLEQQAASDPTIRTPDLPNPFNTSILRSPMSNNDQSGRIRELIFERK